MATAVVCGSTDFAKGSSENGHGRKKYHHNKASSASSNNKPNKPKRNGSRQPPFLGGIGGTGGTTLVSTFSISGFIIRCLAL